MALSNEDKAKLRRALERDMTASGLAITYTKGIVDAAIDTLDEWFGDQAPIVSGCLNAATSQFGGFTLTGAQKKRLGAYYFEHRFNADRSG